LLLMLITLLILMFVMKSPSPEASRPAELFLCEP
jgi:hypothetical protein